MVALLTLERRWLGFAPRTYAGQIVDGMRRIGAARIVGVKVPKAVELPSSLEVARWLALQRHFSRSLAWQRERLGGIVPLHVPREIASELRALEHADEKAVARRRVLKQRRTRVEERAAAMSRLNSLLRCVEGRGYGATALELRDAMREWVTVPE